jgi:hypothetical protein
MDESTIADLGYLTEKNAKYHIFDGTYTTPAGTDQYIYEFIKELWMPNSVHDKGPITTSITQEEHHQRWKWQKEWTTAKSMGQSFSHYKAALESPTLAEMDRIL